MKLTCTKNNLKKALGIASKAIGANTTLPVLNNLLFKSEHGQLKISSTNLEIAIKTWVGGQIESQGEITVPARTVTDYVNNLNDEKITLETKESDLLIKTESTQSTVKGLPAEDFPLIPEVTDGLELIIKTEDLITAVNQVAFASAFSETQPELSGVLFHVEGKEMRIAATDRYRLAEKKIDLEKETESKKIIVPNRVISELSRILQEGKKETGILISDNQILFKIDGTEVISRLIEGQYPDYPQIIPKEFSTKIVLDTSELISALKLSGLFAQDNNNVDLEIVSDQNKIVLKAASQRAGSNETEVKGQASGQNNQIIFNYRYILDCLNHLKENKVELRLINSSSPAMIVPEGQANYLYLVMPIKT